MTNVSMRRSLISLALILSAVATPALAYKGTNYGEGDPTPMTVRSERSTAAVAAEAHEWTRTAPTQGYLEGQTRAIEPVKMNLRAQVHADTLNWMRSGLSDVQYKEAGADYAQLPYRQAAQAYARFQQGVSTTAASTTTVPGSVAR
jgi:hypothetical protein